MKISDSVKSSLEKIGDLADSKNIKSFVVGGFVRDTLLNKNSLDIDIVIEGDALPFADELGHKIDAEPQIFERFHTAKLKIDDLDIDLASARKEVYEYPGALPTVTLGTTLYEDLFRRDFTINAMALSLSRSDRFSLVDFFNGASDLKQGLIRVLHDKSFIDDPTRLYRALRFAHRFNFRMDDQTWGLFKHALKYKTASSLSLKRIAAEITKIFTEPKPGKIMKQLKRAKLLKKFPCSIEIKNLNLSAVSSIGDFDIPAVYWAYLLQNLQPSVKAPVMAGIGLPHKTRLKTEETLDALKKIPKQLLDITKEDHIRLFEILHKYGNEALAALISFGLPKDETEKIMYYCSKLRGISPSITGKELLQAGLKPGPHIREILNYITELKLEGQSLTVQEEINIGKQLYKNI